MPARALRPCPHPGCSRLTRAGRCDAHRYVGPAHQRKKGERRVYDTRLWRDHIRPAKLGRSPLCEDCEERGLIVVATDVDHVDGDSSNCDDENLRSRCHPCHSRKTALHDGGFGNARRR